MKYISIAMISLLFLIFGCNQDNPASNSANTQIKTEKNTTILKAAEWGIGYTSFNILTQIPSQYQINPGESTIPVTIEIEYDGYQDLGNYDATSMWVTVDGNIIIVGSPYPTNPTFNLTEGTHTIQFDLVPSPSAGIYLQREVLTINVKRVRVIQLFNSSPAAQSWPYYSGGYPVLFSVFSKFDGQYFDIEASATIRDQNGVRYVFNHWNNGSTNRFLHHLVNGDANFYAIYTQQYADQ